VEYLVTPHLLLEKKEDCGSEGSQASPDRPSSTSSSIWSISGMTLAGKTKAEVLGEKLPQCHDVHQKTYTDKPVTEG
jgi:hypothetical protein